VTALSFGHPHLFRSDIAIAVQPDGSVAGCIVRTGIAAFTVYLPDEDSHSRPVGTRRTTADAERLLLDAWAERFEP